MLAILITRVSWLLNRLQCWWIFWHFYIENKFFLLKSEDSVHFKKQSIFRVLLLSGEGYKFKTQFFFQEGGQYQVLKSICESVLHLFILKFTFCGVNWEWFSTCRYKLTPLISSCHRCVECTSLKERSSNMFY